MVKEVEFSNVVELLNSAATFYSDGPNQPMFDGKLSNEGKSLTITVGRKLPIVTVGGRMLILYFGNVDFENKLINYTELSRTDLEYDSTGLYNREYTFDISKVLTIPRKVYNTSGTSEITIDLYTYEANITTDYGSKRLSVPYSVNADSTYTYDNSTDGLFKLVMVDFPLWNINTTYYKGDIAIRDGALIVCRADGVVGSYLGWETPTDIDIENAVYGATFNEPLSAIISDILISRHAKYNYIMEALKSTGFKEYDDVDNFRVVKLMQSYREKALFDLLDHQPISAVTNLMKLRRAFSIVNNNNDTRLYEINYTL
jgi:hypothetical protein